MVSQPSHEGEDVSMALVSQIECERKGHNRANGERLWKAVQVACMNEKVWPPPTGHRGRRDLVGKISTIGISAEENYPIIYPIL